MNYTFSNRHKLVILLIVFVLPLFFSSCKATRKTRRRHETSTHYKKETKAKRGFYIEYSKKLGIELTGSENKRLIQTINDWVGVPYKFGGCTKKGIDCSCFVKIVVKEVYGYNLPRKSSEMIKSVNRKNRNALKDGDLVFFKISGDKISHVGIYIGNNKFIHASRSRGVIINDLDDSYYKRYYFTGGSLKY